MKKISVAIDGPAGAGKSSVARAAAEALGYVYVDTGAMYRAAAVYALDSGIDPETGAERLVSELDRIDIAFAAAKGADGAQTVLLNGRDVTKRIREADASMGASAVAAIPEVRAKLTAEQKKMGEAGGVIMDGRDIGTSVLPGAELKIYLTASADERAMRRYKEIAGRGESCDFESIKRDVARRDENDMNRAVSPLRRAEDAVLLDTSELSFGDSVEKVIDLIKEREKHVL